MSYTTGTTFYNLPQTVGTDKRDWFDTNQAFADVDSALHTAVTGQAADAEAIAAINTQLASDEADIAALQATTSTHTSQIASLSTATSQNTSDIGDLRSDAEDMISAYNEGSAATSTRAYSAGDYFIYNDVLYKATKAIAIGDTIVPNTNCRATNVTTEISTLNSDLFKWIAHENYKIESDTEYANVTYIDKTSATSVHNLPHLVHQTAAGTPITGMPSDISGGFIGIRYVHFYDANNIVIELHNLTSNTNFDVYYRKYNGNTWSNWYKVTATVVS